MALSWKCLKLGEVSNKIQTGPFGSQLHMSDYSSEGTPVVMPKDMVNGKIIENSISRVSQDHVTRLSRHKVEEGNILYSRRGDVGKCSYVTKKEEGWLCGTGCLKVDVNKNFANPKFVFYQLQRPETIGWVVKNAIGATMLNLNTVILSNVPIFLPNLNTQEKIVSIFSSYDDLIENNNKQIKLLEEAAQKLYKEWFVKFNFPGHNKDTDGEDGIPEGFHKGKLEEIGLFKRGKVITKAQTEKGNIPVIAGGIEPAYYHNKANTLCPVITISASGNAGFVRMYNCEVWASDCSYLDNNATKVLYFAYTLLKSKQDYLYSLQKGACQKHVNANEINSLEMIIPSEELIQKFNDVVKPFFENIRILEKQNLDLQTSRDKLLPKLMNQEIEVTA